MSITNQVGPSGTSPYVNQCQFGQIVGRVSAYAKHISLSEVQNLVNNVVRRIYDRRYWYGNFVKGQMVSNGYYSTGSVSLTYNSTAVTGIGTNWNSSMVGWQFRLGFIAPVYTVVAVPSSTQLILELPWGLPSLSSTGYFLAQVYFYVPNLKYIYSIKNLQMFFRMLANVPQTLIENWDPGRLQMFYPRVLANMPPNPQGWPGYEMWPAPNTVQAFPYLGYIQPPNLVDDDDTLPAFIRSDVVELASVSEVLLLRPKQNPGYSENLALQMSNRFKQEFEIELESAMRQDEGLTRQDMLTAEEQFPTVQLDWSTGSFLGGGAYLQAISPYSAWDDY